MNDPSEKSLIFVIGTGRSGTHLIGRTIGNSHEVYPLIEDSRTFSIVSKLIRKNFKVDQLLHELIQTYEEELGKVTERYILEKSHPNIWIVESLLEHFRSSKFLGIRRSVYSTVSSMLNHRGVLKWYKVLSQNEISAFLGITESNRSIFHKLPLEAKCALRRRSHMDRLGYLENTFSEHVLVINYEDFYLNSENLILELKRFLKLDALSFSEPLIINNLNKWESQLSKEQIRNFNLALQGDFYKLI